MLIRLVFERNTGDLKLTLNVLACLTRVIDRLDKSAVIDEVLPLLWDVKLQDPEIIQAIVSKSLLNLMTFLRHVRSVQSTC